MKDKGFTSRREMIYFVIMVVGIQLSIFLFLFSAMMCSIANDLVGVIQNNNAEIAELERQLEDCSYSFWEMYDEYVYCVEGEYYEN